jgi:hypothetical protein
VALPLDEKADMRALREALRFWQGKGWNSESIALGWMLARGYERERAQELAERHRLARWSRQ